ncbi:Wall-associated receptor kinase-like 2 [Bienertia sinuspersici]
MKITLEGELLVRYPISYRCYESNTTAPSAEYKAFIRTKRFPLSTTRNIFGSLGCDTFVMLNGTMNSLREFRSGCMTVCATLEDVNTRTCSGIGCCLVSIPEGVTNVDLTFTSPNDQKLVQEFNPCSVAFVLAKDHAVNDTLPYSIKQILTKGETYYQNLKFPVVFYWSIGEKSCKSAQADGNLMCKVNSKCHDRPYHPGYLCLCNPGFQGNPYLHGCQDIDECAEGNNNLCKEPAFCINTLGSYKCRCPQGSSGKGTYSDPCIPDANTANYKFEEFLITWKMRLQIASDSAAALAYLHSSSSIPIFHRDIKSSNILLDEKYKAKLSDFGTSRSVTTDQTHVTTRVIGTFGYLDPEYFHTSQFTEKSDVYSFGVVLVELLTGQKAIRARSEEDRSLTSWFLSYMENSCLFDIVDSQILQEGMKEEFITIANLAKRCLNLDRQKRPTMKGVLLEIETVLSLHLPHKSEKHEPKSVQLSAQTTKKLYHNAVSTSSTFDLESSSSSAAENLTSIQGNVYMSYH